MKIPINEFISKTSCDLSSDASDAREEWNV